LNKSHEMWQWL